MDEGPLGTGLRWRRKRGPKGQEGQEERDGTEDTETKPVGSPESWCPGVRGHRHPGPRPQAAWAAQGPWRGRGAGGRSRWDSELRGDPEPEQRDQEARTWGSVNTEEAWPCSRPPSEDPRSQREPPSRTWPAVPGRHSADADTEGQRGHSAGGGLPPPCAGHAGTARHLLSLLRAQPPAGHPRASPALAEGSESEQRPSLCLPRLPPPRPPLAQKDQASEEVQGLKQHPPLCQGCKSPPPSAPRTGLLATPQCPHSK